jgi:hypothetical protein
MKRKVRRYAEGGVGYEEDPKPGVQSDKKSSSKKSGSGKTPSRRVSSMEFIKKYETSGPSSRIKEEAETTVARTKSGLPGDRSTGYSDKGKSPYVDMDQEDVDRALKRMGEAAERATDKAGEAARRGLSRRGIPRYDERYRASSEGSDRRAAYADELPEGLKFKRGGSVKSSASRRADGIAKKGKTRGRFV